MRVLRARLLARPRRAAAAEASAARAHAGPYGRPVASGSAPTTSRRTGSPTTGSATRPTTSTRCSTATSTRVIQALVDADHAAHARPGDGVTTATGRLRSRAEATARLAAAGVDSPRHDAEELAAHVLGGTRRPVASRRRSPRRVRAAGRPARGRASRCSTSPACAAFATSSCWSARACSSRGPRPSSLRARPSRRSRRRRPRPVVVDLGTGQRRHRACRSPRGPRRDGARRRARSPRRWCGLARNAEAGGTSSPARGDCRRRAAELDGTVDVVVSNPPYLPDGTWTRSTPRCARSRRSRSGGARTVSTCPRGGRRGGRAAAARRGLRRRARRCAMRQPYCSLLRGSAGWADVVVTATSPAATAFVSARSPLSRTLRLRLRGPARAPASAAAVSVSPAVGSSSCPPTRCTASAPTHSRPTPSTRCCSAKGRGRDMPVPVLVGAPRRWTASPPPGRSRRATWSRRSGRAR